MTKWMLRQSSADISALSRELNMDPVLVRFLAVRGYRTVEMIRDFISADLPTEHDPFLFADMQKAVSVAANAIKNHLHCAVFGDYDADGIMSTLILLQTLRSLGLQVDYHIPQRETEGYGLNKEAIQTLFSEGVQVLFACDNGISAFEQIQFAKDLGMQIVVLDHHAVPMSDDAVPQQILPPADAVVDAKREDCKYPFSSLCAAGVCYRFSEALYLYLNKDWSELRKKLLPFATIATVCDLVEMLDENRHIVRCGLPALRDSDNLGLQSLIRAAGLDDKNMDTYHVGFILGPCINASGRLDIADTAVELFLSEEPERAYELASQLVALNQQRRKLTEEGAALAYEKIYAEGLDQDRIIVLHCDSAQESIAGIIAGRVKEKFGRPCIILVGNHDVVRGSCRSVDCYNIYEGLFACRELLEVFGGHPMAAGLSIRKDRIPLLRQQINEQCSLSETDMEPVIRIDCPLAPSQVSLDLAQALKELAPFGKGNPQPLFAAKKLRLIRILLLGRDDHVMRWQFRQADGMFAEAIDFNGRNKLETYICGTYGDDVWNELLEGHPSHEILLDIVFHINVNQYNGRESAQLQIVDFRPVQENICVSLSKPLAAK